MKNPYSSFCFFLFCLAKPGKVRASSYITQYPVLRIKFKVLYTLPPWQTFSIKHHLGFSGCQSHMLQLMREGCLYIYPPLSIARYSFIQLGELEQCRMKKLAQGFNAAAQDSNPGSRSRESEALPLSHCTAIVLT